jgi:hypothetical protein
MIGSMFSLLFKDVFICRRPGYVFLVLACWLSVGCMSAVADSLRDGFHDPSDSARPHTWWHWMNGHVSSEGITRELEAMKEAGLGGFTLFNASEGTPAAGPVDYMSEEWWALLEHTLAEADRLGLEMGIHNSAGWASTGGPWVTPEKAMQEVVWTETRVAGPTTFDGVLDIPEPALGIERDMARNPEVNQRYYVPREQVRGYYRDIALFAFPTLGSDVQGRPFRLENWRVKAGFAKLRGGYSPDKRRAPVEDRIDPDEIIELTSVLDSDGRLVWEVPPGDWTLLRIGYQPTGRQNHPAPVDGRGLEINKLSADAVDHHWSNSIAKVIHAAGNYAGGTFNSVLIDSYEVGHQNWNHSFAQDFRHLRGYDLNAYLPALTGRVIGDVKTTERFLWDFRKTISDLMVRNYYGRFAELSRGSGLTFSAEAYGRYGNFDDFLASGVPHRPMAEWWAFRNSPYHSVTAKLSASAAHTYGRPVVDSEAFTGPPDSIFEEHPYSLKAQGDYFFTRGVNRFSFHTFAHDPYNKPPGIGLGTYGSRFDSRNTWWPYARAWMDYLARCQYMLQEGRFVADLLYFTGEDAPQEATPREALVPPPPAGFDYDFGTREILEQIEVRDGRLELPSGMSYRVLVLPESPHMRPGVLRTIEKLVAAGAVVVGPKPELTPGLEGGREAEEELLRLANRLWGESDGSSVTVNGHGEGRIYWGQCLDSVIAELGLKPAFAFELLSEDDFGETQYPGDGVEFIHRRAGETDYYFISNQHHASKRIEATFRVSGQMPELWHPDTGRTGDAPRFRSTADGRTAVMLDLGPADSVFVVFRRPIRDHSGVVAVEGPQGSALDPILHRGNGRLSLRSREGGEFLLEMSDGSRKMATVSPAPAAIELAGAWEVSFPEGWGAPERIEIPELMCWTNHADYDVRHFSGTASYRKEVELADELFHEDVVLTLDLGGVKVLAEVWVNGRNLGVLWKQPYAVEVTDAMQPGSNQLEIRVTNLWVNRILGDRRYPDDLEWTGDTGSTARGEGLAKFPDWVVNGGPRPSSERKTFVTWRWPHMEDKDLLPSGLLGPVRLIAEREVNVD